MYNTFNHQGEYVCECGKEFTNSQAFNGHKCHCKIHLGEEKYNEQLKRDLKASKKGLLVIATNKKKKAEEKLQQWVSEQHTCEHCGKIMTEKYGSGRFCSSKCAHSRKHSENTKQKIRDTIAKSQQLNPKLIHRCSICGKILRRPTKTTLCIDCLHNTAQGIQLLKEAGKKGYQTQLQNGTHIGWQKRNIQSYPEQFWQQVLNNNHIIFEGPNKPIKKADNKNNYFLDFYIEKDNYKIDLEIDGKQHQYEDRQKSDKIRDEYLESLGYIIYRTSWNEINSENGKYLMKQKIDKFITWYNNL